MAVVVATRWPSRSMVLTPACALRAGSRDLGMTEVRTPSLARRHLSNIEAGPSEPMREHLKLTRQASPIFLASRCPIH